MALPIIKLPKNFKEVTYKKILTKDNAIPVGMLFCDNIQDALDKYPILYSASFYEDFLTEVRKKLPKALVMEISYFTKGDPIMLEKSNYGISQKLGEKPKNYAKRILKYCEDNQINLITKSVRSLNRTDIEIF